MPFRKYRSVEDMPGARRMRPLDPESLPVACDLTELAYRMQPWRFEPGVRKFRSVEEAEAHRERWRREQVRRSGTAEE